MTAHRSRLLVAHRNSAICDGLAGILRRRGYAVARASDSDAAVALIAAGGISAAFSDSHLPPAGLGPMLDACARSTPAVVIGEPHTPVPPSVLDHPRVVGVLPHPYPLDLLTTLAVRATLVAAE